MTPRHHIDRAAKKQAWWDSRPQGWKPYTYYNPPRRQYAPRRRSKLTRFGELVVLLGFLALAVWAGATGQLPKLW